MQRILHPRNHKIYCLEKIRYLFEFNNLINILKSKMKSREANLKFYFTESAKIDFKLFGCTLQIGRVDSTNLLVSRLKLKIVLRSFIGTQYTSAFRC